MSLTLEIKVVPSSGTQRITIDKAGAIKLFLKSPPEKGLANKELIKFLAKELGVPQDRVEIIGGATTRKKIVKIHVPLSRDQALVALGIAKQLPIF